MDSAISQRKRSTWSLGQTAEFPFTITKPSGEAVELLDPSLYPAFAFVSPSGLQVQTGVAAPNGAPGKYIITWTIPLQAELSNDVACWTLQINALTKRRKPIEMNLEFDIVDDQVSKSNDKDLCETVLEGKSFRAVWRGDFDPEEISVECYYTASPNDPNRAPLISPVPKSMLKRTIDGDSIAYYYDIPAASFNNGTTTLLDNKFTVLWNTRETVLSSEDQEYKQLRVIRKAGFEKITSLRFLVDRFQHRFGSAQYMSDGDMVEALTKGLGMFNQWFPYSSYTAETFPQELETFWTMFGAWWMLQSQRMLVAQLAFSFSGQSITLDYDQTGAIDSAISGLVEWLNTHVTPAKTMVFRRRSLGGIAAVRPARLAAGLYNRVVQFDSTRGGAGGAGYPGIMGIAQSIGLIP
jgi:hypothetical protein